MIFHILTLFPEMVMQGLNASIIGRAMEKQLISVKAVNIRDYTQDKHGKVDDYTYGGGAGMLMQAQPVYDAWKAVSGDRKLRTIYVTPQGVPFHQKLAEELSKEEELIFLCGHYEGIDERVLEEVVTDYVSIGDYVLTGGELPAMVMIDAISRLVPGVLHNEVSANTESFHNDLLEYPQYSRPEVWHGKTVPKVLLAGDHKKITAWRLEQSKARTAKIRPDLYQKYKQKESLIKQLKKQKRNHIYMIEHLERGRTDVLYHEKENILLYDKSSKLAMLQADDGDMAEKLLDMIPPNPRMYVTNQGFLKEWICRKFPHVTAKGYIQSLYTPKEHLKVTHKDIRLLSIEDLPYVCASCKLEEKDIAGLIVDNRMYGAFLNDRLVGFVGSHENGCLGLLYVEEAYQRRHIGASLVSFYTNRMIEQGYTPYGYTVPGNEPFLKLLEKLGYYTAEKMVYFITSESVE